MHIITESLLNNNSNMEVDVYYGNLYKDMQKSFKIKLFSFFFNEAIVLISFEDYSDKKDLKQERKDKILYKNLFQHMLDFFKNELIKFEEIESNDKYHYNLKKILQLRF